MFLKLISPEFRSLANQLRRADPKERIKYYALGVGGALFWLGLFFFFWFVLSKFNQVEIFGPYLVKKLLSILLLALFSLLCFSNLISAISAFYLSDDLPLIHGLPISLRNLHASRFALTFLNSSWMMVIFGLPVFLAYGVVHHAPALYYLALITLLPAFLVIPTAVGSITATLLVNIFPARRTKELMVLMSLMFIVGLFLLLRIVQPEKLVDAESFSDVLAFLGQIQTPTATYLPSHWALEVLVPLLTGDAGQPGLYFARLVSTAGVAFVVSQWTCILLYPAGWTKAQQASASTDRKIGLFDAMLRLLTWPLPPAMRAMMIKDIKTLFRDSAEWSQLLLILALIIVYLYSVKVLPLDGPFITLRIHNIISFVNLAMVGFVVSSIAVRFLFTSVSVEGRVFWLLRAAPMDPMQFLLAKYLTGLPLLLGLGLILVILSNLLLNVRPTMMVLGIVTMIALSTSLAGLSVGIGALYPNFKAENIAKIAAGPGGILFMIVAQAFVALVLLIEALPVYLIVRGEFRRTPLAAWEWSLILLFVAIAIGVNIVAAIVPMRRGARALREMT